MGRRRGAGQGGVFLEPGEWKQAIRREELSATQQQRALDPKNVEPLRKYLVPEEVKEVEGEEERVLRFTISTASVDRDRDTISVDGWDLTNYLKNPVVLFGHDYGDLPVGKSLDTFVEDGKLKSDAQFPSEELYPFGYTVYQMYLGGYMRATSVGFLPTKWAWVEEDDRPFGVDFEEQELLEYSCVPVPSNPEALMEARSKGIDTAPLKEWAEKVLDGEMGPGLWVPKRAVEDMAKVLGGEKSKLSANWQNVTASNAKDPEAAPEPEEPEGDDAPQPGGGATSDAEGGEGQTETATDSPVGRQAHTLVEILTVLRARALGVDLKDAPDAWEGSLLGTKLPSSRLERQANVLLARMLPDLDPESFEKIFPEALGAGLVVEEVTKAGRVLSKANEDRIVQIRDVAQELLDQLENAPEVDDGEAGGVVDSSTTPGENGSGNVIDLSSLDPARIRNIVGEEVRGEVGRLRGHVT